MDEAGIFHQIPRLDDSRLGEIFAREVLAMFVRKELLSPEWAERILSWRHTGFSVHTEYAVADKFMEHLKLTFVAEKPPPAHVFEQVVLLAAEKILYDKPKVPRMIKLKWTKKSSKFPIIILGRNRRENPVGYPAGRRHAPNEPD